MFFTGTSFSGAVSQPSHTACGGSSTTSTGMSVRCLIQSRLTKILKSLLYDVQYLSVIVVLTSPMEVIDMIPLAELA